MTVAQLFDPKKEYFSDTKALIFDFDGTLVDSMRFWMDARALSDGLDVFYENIAKNYATSVDPKPFATELLTLLHKNGIPVCIATDTPMKLSKGFFEKHGLLELVDFYISGADVGVSKRNGPHIYFEAAKRLGVKPEECVVFEDLLSSAVTAKNAGFPVVGVYDTFSSDDIITMKKLCTDYVYNLRQLVL